MLNERQTATFDYLFTVIDASGNGSIEEADFLFSLLSLDREIADAEKKDDIEKAMRRWYLSLKVFADKDTNKVVSKEEWMTWAEGLAAELAETGELGQKHKRFTDALFAVIALDERTLTKESYVEWFSGLGLGGDANANFAQLDVNNNGSVTKDEFYAQLLPLLKGEEGAVQLLGRPKTILDFLEERINSYAEAILMHEEAGDAMMLGGLKFFFTMRDALTKSTSTREIGVCDAVNDFLQFKGIVPEGKNFIKDDVEAVDFSSDAEAVANFVEGKIDHYAQSILDGSNRADAFALGELETYMVFRRELNGEATSEDKGMTRAINDVLKYKKILSSGKHFIK